VQAIGYGVLLAVSSSIFPGCADAEDRDDSIAPTAEVINRASQALSIGEVQAVEGSYVGCRSRSGHWSLAVGGATSKSIYPELSVLRNDKGCTLSLERLLADQTYEAGTAVPLGTDFAAEPAASAPVVDSTRGSTAFFANAKISAEGFAGAFALTFVYSDDPNLADVKGVPTDSLVHGDGSITAVAVPDYTLVLDGLSVVQDGTKIDSTSGEVVLMSGKQAGETFVVVEGLLDSNVETIKAAYANGTVNKLSDAIDGALLGLAGASLPVERSVIIAHTQDGVASYQVVRISF
jgi:hypothetical protein